MADGHVCQLVWLALFEAPWLAAGLPLERSGEVVCGCMAARSAGAYLHITAHSVPLRLCGGVVGGVRHEVVPNWCPGAWDGEHTMGVFRQRGRRFGLIQVRTGVDTGFYRGHLSPWWEKSLQQAQLFEFPRPENWWHINASTTWSLGQIAMSPGEA